MIERGYKKKLANQLTQAGLSEWNLNHLKRLKRFELMRETGREKESNNSWEESNPATRFEDQIKEANVVFSLLLDLIHQELKVLLNGLEAKKVGQATNESDEFSWEDLPDDDVEVSAADLPPLSALIDLMSMDEDVPFVPLIDNLLAVLNKIFPPEEKVTRIIGVLELGRKVAEAFRYPDNPAYQDFLAKQDANS